MYVHIVLIGEDLLRPFRTVLLPAILWVFYVVELFQGKSKVLLGLDELILFTVREGVDDRLHLYDNAGHTVYICIAHCSTVFSVCLGVFSAYKDLKVFLYGYSMSSQSFSLIA